MKNHFYNAFDLERLVPKYNKKDYRSPFQIDRDRILHTPAFRSLQNKTQVFWSGEYDFYRTRLTHSLEVAQIGRSICHWLQYSQELMKDNFCIDWSLVEAACLAHDIGHPPFGHSGERALNILANNAGGFEGNAQTLRLLCERIFSEKGAGMNPTRALLDSVLKYKTIHRDKMNKNGGAPPKNHFIYDEQEPYLLWAHANILEPLAEYPRSIECQIMDWADDTAYCLHDVADAFRIGFLKMDDVFRWTAENNLSDEPNTPMGDLLTAMMEGHMDSFAGIRIGKFIQATSLQENDEHPLSNHSNRYRHTLHIDKTFTDECETFKRLTRELVFSSPEIKQLEHQGVYTLKRLWKALYPRYVEQNQEELLDFDILPQKWNEEFASSQSIPERTRLLCDYLSTLTDQEAMRMTRRLYEPGFGSLGDVV